MKVRLLVAALVAGGGLASAPWAGASHDSQDGFGPNGRLLVGVSHPTVDVVNDVTVGYSSAITVAGSAGERMAVVRYSRFGDLDFFGGDGVVTADFGVASAGLGVVLTPFDDTLAVGQAGGQLAIAMFDRSGHPSLPFGQDGKVTASIGASSAGQAVSTEGMVAGWTSTGGQRDLLLARVQPWGLDPGFNGTGTRVVDLGQGTDDAGYAVQRGVASSTAFYVGGNVGGAAVLAGFDDAGSLNPGFGTGGKLVLDLTAGPDVVRDIAYDVGRDGLFIAGQAGDHAFVARVLENGTLDPAFAGGVVQFDLGGVSGDGPAVAVTVQSGRPVVAGTTTTGTGSSGAARRFLRLGAPDPTFGGGGLVRTGASPATGRVSGIAMQQAGDFALVGDDGANMVLTGFDRSGGIDKYFGGGRPVVTDAGTTGFQQGQVPLAYPDGRILLLGNFGGELVMARRLPDGRPDPTFGAGGMVIEEFGGGTPTAGAIQSDGRILVSLAGWVLRYLPDGERDPTFGVGGNGFAMNNPCPLRSCLRLLADGRILVGGNGGVARLLPTGVPDPSFGNAGFATLPGYRAVAGIALQSGGRIVVVAPEGYVDTITLGRFMSDGVVDTSFGGVLDNIGLPVAVATLPDDRIVIAASTYGVNGTGDLAVARLSPTGARDVSFGTNGRTRVDLGGYEAASDLVLEGQSVIVAGEAGRFDQPSQVLLRTGFLARLTPSGLLDAGFEQSGVAVYPYDSSYAGVARAPDGSFVAAGWTTGYPHGTMLLTRTPPASSSVASPPSVRIKGRSTPVPWKGTAPGRHP